MRHRFIRRVLWSALFLASGLACGARTGLLGIQEEPEQLCEDGESTPCGSTVGACKPGQSTCVAGVQGPCEGALGPSEELCNGVDDDCDGDTDEGFQLGEACDGQDNDMCLDDVMTCDGCSTGADITEICNGKDDNCNGIIDADCEVGDCEPTLIVTGSTPSSPSCIDFPVEQGSTGVIQFPCEGGAVSAQLGDIGFTGAVQNGEVMLTGEQVVVGPDHCLWQTSHTIYGSIHADHLSYAYAEALLDHLGNLFCWSPCSESGTVEIEWVAAP